MTGAIIRAVNNEQSIVFGGVAWKPVIGSGLAAQSEKLAAADKATHYVTAGEHSSAVGTTKLPAVKIKEKGRAFYSAAAIFAQAHPSGVQIYSQEFPGDDVWVVASHDGVVISDTDVLLTRIEAEELVADIKLRHALAVVITGEFDAIMHLNVRTQLKPVRNAIQKIPSSAKVMVVVLLLLLVVDTSLSWYKDFKLRKLRELEQSQYIDAHAEWKNKLNQWASTIKPDGRQGLINIYFEMGNAPMKIGGWNISEATCLTSATGWDCNARYEAGVGSTNISFQENLPRGWTANWGGLTTAVGNWTVQVERKSLDRSRIQKIPDFSLVYISALQRVLPAMKKVDLSAPAPAPIQEPQVYIDRGKGNELVNVPYPVENTAGIELPKIQTLDIEAPLRTLAVLPLIDDTVIKQLRFVVGSQRTVPTIRDGMFTSKLIGDIYVR
ncbi:MULTISPECIES: type 4b pilus protein PilO2 [unclassified Pseudomonas]|uniref:type 4b pilus protein PilO2 n=1 Tax=unclassified Pseudomonas TaxID=196821 RepID=UPI0014736508|nr:MULTISPECIES: type 4b pilus protein PilO2 [unclassified Pseudomonas]NMX92484.1 type 4b pilus protein PilO2 [Pseudomonas sp. WS 5086]NMY47238.1 type 4b pilus protein PilO2 [Pseudomonas sp. WS 5027]